jgi:polyhydroxyalkanoate synthesis regulator phasin
VNRAWERYLDTATSLTEVTRKRAEQVVRNLVKQGEIAAERAERAVDELLKRTETNRKAVAALVKKETERAVAGLGLARQRDVERLERKVERIDGPSDRPSAKKSTAKKSTAKKSTAKKSTAKKSTAKKSTAKKGPAKKTTPSAAAADNAGTRSPDRTPPSGGSGQSGGA